MCKIAFGRRNENLTCVQSEKLDVNGSRLRAVRKTERRQKGERRKVSARIPIEMTGFTPRGDGGFLGDGENAMFA